MCAENETTPALAVFENEKIHEQWFGEYLRFLEDVNPIELPNKIPEHYEQ